MKSTTTEIKIFLYNIFRENSNAFEYLLEFFLFSSASHQMKQMCSIIFMDTNF